MNSSTSPFTSVAAVFDNAIDAHIAQGMLQSHGIPSMLDNEIFSSIYPLGASSGFTGVKLIVNNEDLERALTLLNNSNDL